MLIELDYAPNRRMDSEVKAFSANIFQRVFGHQLDAKDTVIAVEHEKLSRTIEVAASLRIIWGEPRRFLRLR